MSLSDQPDMQSLSDSSFERIAARISEMAGIVLEPRKKQMIFSRLNRRVRALDLSGFDAYIDFLDSADGASEQQDFVNALTTNLTSFFREGHHYDHLRKEVIAPTLAAGRTRLRIWSAGCSTGEEPYSTALCLAEAVRPIPDDFKILATDIDTKVLEHCRAATYDAGRNQEITQRFRNFLSIDKAAEQFSLSPEVRRCVSFKQLNLMQNWPMSGPFDVIFCRNVLIYFSRETKASLLDRFVQKLVPGGFLYLGHSEPILQEHPHLISKGQTMYQRRVE
ncbi:CheR family methyltransferase [Halovulum sp. GXIMD14793]